MTDRSLRRRSRVLLAIAIVLIITGLASVATYVVNFVGVLGQADQSMAFWLLPLLQLGLAAAGVGTVMVVLWLLLVSTGAAPVERDGDRETHDR